MHTTMPCARASLPPSNANCSSDAVSLPRSRHAWPASASSKASTIPPGGTPPWGIARPFATNRRCKQTDSPPPLNRPPNRGNFTMPSGGVHTIKVASCASLRHAPESPGGRRQGIMTIFPSAVLRARLVALRRDALTQLAEGNGVDAGLLSLAVHIDTVLARIDAEAGAIVELSDRAVLLDDDLQIMLADLYGRSAERGGDALAGGCRQVGKRARCGRGAAVMNWRWGKNDC